jgi:hypothetical protein
LAFRAARAATSPDASTSTQTVASGISRRDVVSLSATALRTPVSGMRLPFAAGFFSVAFSRAASTSARRMIPSGPLGVSRARSIPLSEASFRTNGEITPGVLAFGAGASTRRTRLRRVDGAVP